MFAGPEFHTLDLLPGGVVEHHSGRTIRGIAGSGFQPERPYCFPLDRNRNRLEPERNRFPLRREHPAVRVSGAFHGEFAVHFDRAKLPVSRAAGQDLPPRVGGEFTRFRRPRNSSCERPEQTQQDRQPHFHFPAPRFAKPVICRADRRSGFSHFSQNPDGGSRRADGPAGSSRPGRPSACTTRYTAERFPC